MTRPIGRRRRQLPRKANAFTLLEMMIVITIVAAMASLALPIVQQFAIENELTRATNKAFGMVRYARVHSAMRTRAYGIFVTAAAGGASNGEITIVEGSSSSCTSIPDPSLPGTKIMNQFDVKEHFPSVSIIAVTPVGMNLESDGICVKPNGRVVRGDTGAAVPSETSALAAGDIRIELEQKVKTGGGGEARNQPNHKVVIGHNGDVALEY